jgi:hypothetical protein
MVFRPSRRNNSSIHSCIHTIFLDALANMKLLTTKDGLCRHCRCCCCCCCLCAQSFMFDSVPAPTTKKGMQAAALIAAKRKKLAAAAAAAGEAAGTDQDDQGPAKKQRVAG